VPLLRLISVEPLQRALYIRPRRLSGTASFYNRLRGNILTASAHLFGHLDVGTGSGKDGRRFRGPIVSFREREQLVEVVGFEKPEKRTSK